MAFPGGAWERGLKIGASHGSRTRQSSVFLRRSEVWRRQLPKIQLPKSRIWIERQDFLNGIAVQREGSVWLSILPKSRELNWPMGTRTSFARVVLGLENYPAPPVFRSFGLRKQGRNR